jgi:urease accessory protein
MTAARLLQLASPALPIGGYSYSTALEWGIDCGRVTDESSALEWIGDALMLTVASFEGPVMVAALRQLVVIHGSAGGAESADQDAQRDQAGRSAQAAQRARADDAIVALNAMAIACRETVELRLESEQMGFSLGKWLAGVFPGASPDDALRARMTPLSLPVAWAFAAKRLGLVERDALLGLMWAFVENQAMVLMKTLPMGQMAAQRVLLALGDRIEAAVGHALALEAPRWSSAAPALAIASMHHELQYSRLFRS